MSDLPFLPLWVSKYEARTGHLNLEEDGAYTRLLRLSWMTPKCQIPADDAWIMRRMRVDQPTYERVVKPILDEFFYKAEGAWRNERLLAEYTARTQSKKQKSEAGSRGGKNSARKKREKPSESASPPLEAEGKHKPSMPESRIQNPDACKHALGNQIRKALGRRPGSADLKPADIDAAAETWTSLGATEAEILDVIRRQTANPRWSRLRTLDPLTPDIEAAVAARASRPPQPAPRERKPLMPIDEPRAAACRQAIIDRFGWEVAEAWLGGAAWTDDEVQLSAEYDRLQVDQRFGGVLREHGFSAALSAS